MRKITSLFVIVGLLALIQVAFSNSGKSLLGFITIAAGVSANSTTTPLLPKNADRDKPGFPHVNYDDASAAVRADGNGSAAVTSATLATTSDFDSDGVPDLITTGTDGRISFYKGNADTIYPNSPDAKQRRAEFGEASPFSTASTLTQLSFSPDFLESGDFNADGFADLLMAAKGSSQITVLSGNGVGSFTRSQAFPVDGSITAIAVGEIGRSDQQADVAVAYQSRKGAFVAIFEHPEGAFAHKAETFALSAAAQSLAIGSLDKDSYGDVAAACGSQLTLIHGRGQAYPLDLKADLDIQRPAAFVQSKQMPFAIADVAVGRFGYERGESIALLSADGRITLLEPQRHEVVINSNKPTADAMRQAALPSMRPVDTEPRNFGVIKNDSPKTEAEADERGQVMADSAAIKEDREKVFNDKIAALQQDLAKQPASERAAILSARVQNTIEMTARRKAAFEANLASKPVPFSKFRIETIAADPVIANAISSGRPHQLIKGRFSDSGLDDIAMLDAATGRINIVGRWNSDGQTGRRASVASLGAAQESVSIVPMRLNADALSDLVMIGAGSPSVMESLPVTTYTVNSTDDTNQSDCITPNSACTLRRAIVLSNTNFGNTLIAFDIPGTGVHTMHPVANYPDITKTATIDGTTQPGFAGYPLIEISGDLMTGSHEGLKITASSTVVRGLAINQIPSVFDDNNSQVGGSGITVMSTSFYRNIVNVIIEGNFLGTDPTGSVSKANDANGVHIYDADFNTIGGTTAWAGNILSGNGNYAQNKQGVGLAITGGNYNVIYGNYIGTNVLGNIKLGNSYGVFFTGINNQFGGDAFGEGNVVSGNGGPPDQYGRCQGGGIYMFGLISLDDGSLLTDSNTLKGNKIGTNASGTGPLGNCSVGISSPADVNTVIGSITQTGRNIISDNGWDALWCGYASQTTYGLGGGCTIIGNNIGTDITGSTAMRNDQRNNNCIGFCLITDTVWVTPSDLAFVTVGSSGGTTPGGACTGMCNLISGNLDPTGGFGGGGLYRSGYGYVIAVNNYIGVNRSGTAALPNFSGFQSYFGSFVFGAELSDGNGGSISGGNVSSGNDQHGASTRSIYGGGTYEIRGNLIGLSSDGYYPIGNGVGGTSSCGICAQSLPGTSTVIGGRGNLMRNYIAAQTSDPYYNGTRGTGLSISTFSWASTEARNNWIGLNTWGDLVGNSGNGIEASGDGQTKIGGYAYNEMNFIAGNGRAGVVVSQFTGSFGNTPAKNVWIARNSIAVNGGLGIDLVNASQSDPYPSGVTPNDCFDEDDGANGFQNYPELFPAVINGNGTVSIPTTFRSVPSSYYQIDYYQSPAADPSTYGEGSNYIGSKNIQTDGNGFVGFTFTSSDPVIPSQLSFTATATDLFGNTSEFSCVAGQCTTGTFQEAMENPTDLSCIQPILVNINTDENDANTADGFCDVDTNTPGLQCSLRAAIQEANARSGYDIINFDIPGFAIINVMTALPAITERVIVNGISQPGYSNFPLIEVRDGNNVGTGIAIQTNKVTINGLAIHRFLTADISIVGSDNVVESCFLGTFDGFIADNTRQAVAAVSITGGSSQRNRIGGALPANGNVIGNSQTGISIQGGANANTVINNKIGTDHFGTGALPNGVGIAIAGSNGNTIGGILDQDTNLISGNTSAGISITSGANTNRIEGNLIGTDLTGNAALRNGFAGIAIGSSAANNTIGSSNERRNIISGNAPSDGIAIANGAGENTISGNYIGINKAGNLALPNHWGVLILDTTNSVGSSTGPPNIISGNEQGVVIGAQGASVSGVSVVNNRIGTDASGTTLIPNQTGVVLLENVSSSSISGNVISGNTYEGIITGGVSIGPSNITITGNKIGTNQAGTFALPNGTGVLLFSGTQNSIVKGNLISGNALSGLQLGAGGVESQPINELARLLGRSDLTVMLPVQNNKATGNYIGTTVSGGFALGNQKAGVFLGADAFDNQIGGQRSQGEGNLISGNDQNTGIGIAVGTFNTPFDVIDHPKNNKIQGNRIGVKTGINEALPNNIGIKIKFSNNNIIGGDTANCIPADGCDINDYGNIIGGNNQQGIRLEGAFAANNSITYNYIGVAQDGTAIGNGSHGVHLSLGAHNNTIGEGNTIGANGGSGIFIEDGVTPRTEGTQSSQMNRVVGNKIFGNVGLGIDIFPTGANPNDPGDGDEGPNRGQNYPVINNFSIDGGGNLIVSYQLDTDTANANYGFNGIYVQFFKSDVSGQGQNLLNTDYWNANDQNSGTTKTVNLGNASALGIALTDLMTATATDADGNSSEFVPAGAIPSPTQTTSPSPTPNSCVFDNGGFESGNLSPWVAQDNTPPPFVSNLQAYSGSFSAFLGSPPQVGDTIGDSSIFQVVTVPASGGTLSFLYRPETTDTIDYVWQDVYVTDQTGTIVLATILHEANNSQTWTQVNYDMAAFAGTTVAVKFLVHGDGFGFWTNMYVDDVCLSSNSTSTPTGTATATFTPTPPPAITGTVTYGNAVGSPSQRFVSGVQLDAVGSIPISNVTAPDGTYLLEGFGLGAYTITPFKNGGQNAAISSFDAALIGQHVGGPPLPHLTGNQLIVADVSGNGTLSSFDAAMVASYVVSLPGAGSSGNWIFNPVSYTHASVNSSITGENYTALLFGDVSGNWNDPTSLPVGRTTAGSGPEREIAITAPHLAASSGREIIIPIRVDGVANKGIIAYEFDLRYDPYVIRPQESPVDIAETVSSHLTAVSNTETPGILRVAVYGPTPINGNGLLFNLKFTAVGQPGSASLLRWERVMFNEGGLGATATDGMIDLSAATPIRLRSRDSY